MHNKIFCEWTIPNSHNLEGLKGRVHASCFKTTEKAYNTKLTGKIPHRELEGM